jgi:selenocysteine lyase/cysteine desulfurase
VKWWNVPPNPNPQLNPEDLRKLMTPRTKLVTIPHVSNILGTLHDVKAIAKTVHEVEGAMLCVDGVAYAPHGLIDVKDLDIDFYAFSWYKVCHFKELGIYPSTSIIVISDMKYSKLTYLTRCTVHT